MSNNAHTGTLHVVATPIGNLDDMSRRAIETLRSVQLIVAEDTRHFYVLARHFGIDTPVESYHEHNERDRAPQIVRFLLEGHDVALVSDAGTPLISDPGYHVVQQAHEAGVLVRAVPGACAAIAALSCSGFATHRFQFEGFLPIKDGKRRATLADAIGREFPTIFYESPHRIAKTLQTLVELAPEGELFLAREISKLHEEHLRGTATEVFAIAHAHQHLKGEMVLVVAGTSKKLARAAKRSDRQLLDE